MVLILLVNMFQMNTVKVSLIIIIISKKILKCGI